MLAFPDSTFFFRATLTEIFCFFILFNLFSVLRSYLSFFMLLSPCTSAAFLIGHQDIKPERQQIKIINFIILRATRKKEIYHLHTINLCEDTLKESSDLILKYAEGVGFITWQEALLYMKTRKIISFHIRLSSHQRLIQSSTSLFLLILELS